MKVKTGIALGAFVCYCGASCGSHEARPPAPQLPKAHLTLGDSCSPGEPVTCPREAFLRGLEESALLYQEAATCRVDFTACLQSSSIDASVCAGSLSECEQRAGQRWAWAVGGFVTGALAALLAVWAASGS